MNMHSSDLADGGGMARNLIKHGHKVIAWNRSPEPAAALHAEGARIALLRRRRRAAPRLRSPCSPTMRRSNR